ncbi:Flagellar assembly protein FliH [Collimonas arenae]|uniref:Flagellar assembly protein FliH n=1 Tax=Collimonas arenae TaxID=279058 RepID=A0A0A1F9H4_9BURK|nr:flagellar assembly protein FliH [Collimonas arenae]AIY40294.1 Flagellar assembly protein FliH [Collimonas arenae]
MSDSTRNQGQTAPRHDNAGPMRPASLARQQMTAWQRWEMGEVRTLSGQDGSDVPEPSQAEPALSGLEPKLLIDEAELQRLRQQAQDAGAAEGHRQGHAAGWQEGYNAGLDMARSEADSLRQIGLAMPAALRLAEKEVADDLMTLALDIARQVVRQALSAEPQLILAAVRELLQTEPALSGTPRLLLHADDMPLIQQYLAEDLQAAGWLLRADPGITRGGCRVQANSGELDATLETRWQRVAAALGRSIPSHD